MKRAAIILTLLFLASPAIAASQPTVKEKIACIPDAARFCGSILLSGFGPVKDCLVANRTKLSKGCAAVLTKHGT